MGLLVEDAPEVRLPGAFAPWSGTFESDCNCPSHWDGGRFVVFSSARDPWRAEGRDVETLGEPARVEYDRPAAGGRWIEATHRGSNGVLYGWYHHEPDEPFAHLGMSQTVPMIGAARSEDGGRSWTDLGIVLSAPTGSERRDTKNVYFAGGVGDFCVLPDRGGTFLTFYFGAYHGDPSEQGVCVGRLAVEDLDRPAGRVRLWDGRDFGDRARPILPVRADWHGETPDAFWGPSIHYNTHLDAYAMLLNRAVDPGWRQEGIYVAFARDPGDPSGWSAPEKIMGGVGWYPMVVGDPPDGTDKRAGESARLFVRGESRWRIRFVR